MARTRFLCAFSVVAALVFALDSLVSAGAVVNAPPAAGVYVALGDSIEVGVGDDVQSDGIGYVIPFGTALQTVLGPLDVHNLSVPFATTPDIFRTQLPSALALLRSRAPAVVTWGGGGNDLLELRINAEGAACNRLESCLGRFNGALNQIEHTIDSTIQALRQAVGPNGLIIMRTQYNGLAHGGCAPQDVAVFAHYALEGLPGSVLDRGLNTRIRAVASKYNAKVADLYYPFLLNATTYISSDCAHPTGLGYQVIQAIFASALSQ
jgi:lysophospholipase L1-like esterase